MNDDFVGTWRITEMELWDQDFIDLVSPGQIVLYKGNRGSFSFGAVELDIGRFSSRFAGSRVC
jgi:hypothetical protein